MPNDEATRRQQQAEDIARRTRDRETAEWHQGYGHYGPPLSGTPPPAANDPHYAVEGLKGNVAERMRQQGEAATLPMTSQGTPPPIRGSMQGGGSAGGSGGGGGGGGGGTGNPGAGTAPSATPPGPGEMGFVPGPAAPAGGESGGGGKLGMLAKIGGGSKGNPYLAQMQANVNAPLKRVEGFAEGGLVPETGVYQLHQGETVIPKKTLEHYRDKGPGPAPRSYLLHRGEAVVPPRGSMQQGGTAEGAGYVPPRLGEKPWQDPQTGLYRDETVVEKAVQPDWVRGRYGMRPPDAEDVPAARPQWPPGYFQHDPGDRPGEWATYHPYLLRHHQGGGLPPEQRNMPNPSLVPEPEPARPSHKLLPGGFGDPNGTPAPRTKPKGTVQTGGFGPTR